MFEPREWHFRMKTQVGGTCGFGESACVSDIYWERNEYYEGEEANVRILCDNT